MSVKLKLKMRPAPPRITSSASMSGATGEPLSQTCTATQAGGVWAVTGGADASKFTFTGSTLALNDVSTAGTFVCTISYTNLTGVTVRQLFTATLTGAAALLAIADLAATQLDDDTAQLTFTNATGATSHEVAIDNDVGNPRLLTTDKQVHFLLPGDRSFLVRGKNATETAPWSNEEILTITVSDTPPEPEGVQAVHTQVFNDSIGINMHLDWATAGSLWTTSRGWYEHWQDLPIDHIRTGFTAGANGQSQNYIDDMLAEPGRSVKFQLLFPNVDWSSSTIGTRLNAARDRIDAANIASIDSANEVNDDFPAGWEDDANAFQQRLHTEVRSRSEFDAIPVLPVSIWGRNIGACETMGALNGGAGLSAYADAVNVHWYTSGKPGHIGGYPLGPDEGGDPTTDYSLADTIRDHGFVVPNLVDPPVVIGETGYKHQNAFEALTNDVFTEAAAAKYWLQMPLINWLHGVTRTYYYTLIDDANNNNRAHGFMGLSNHTTGTWVIRHVFTAFKNMMELLADPGVTYAPGTLNYSLSGASLNQDVIHLLLQKRNGEFYLLLVNLQSIWPRVAPFAEISRADKNITVTMGQSVSQVRSYRPHVNQTATTLTINGSGAATNVVVPVKTDVTLVRITP